MADEPLDNSSYEERRKLVEDIKNIEEASSSSISSAISFGKEYNRILSKIKGLKQDINIFQEQITAGEANGKKLTQEEINLLTKKVSEYKKIVSSSEAITKNLSKSKIVLNSLVNSAKDFGNNLDILSYLMEADGAIRTMNRDLGVSGVLADQFRENISDAAGQAANMGLSIKELTELQLSFVETTGKILPLSQVALERTAALSKATGLAASEAGDLVGNFNQIGLSAEGTANFIEQTLNSSEKMGISGVKTVKLIKDNFDKINKYRFQGGIESFKSMVQFSQKVNQNLNDVFSAAEKFSTLEGAIEASARLQTLGGNMAIDPFMMGFLSRNDPEKFAQKLNEMTRGVYNFNKSTGQFSASAVDMQRLKILAEETGQDFEQLNKQARKTAEIEFISSKTIGLTKEDRELVSQLAQFDETSKSFKIKLDGKDIDIDKITDQQLKLLTDQQKSLEQRGKQSQAFDEQISNLMMQLKSTLLPVLTLINKMLTSIDSFFGNSTAGLVGKLATLGTSMLILKGISSNLGTMATSLVKLPFTGVGKLMGGGAGAGGAISGGVGQALGGGAGAAAGAENLGTSLGKLPSKESMFGSAKGLLSIGAASLMIAGSLWIASKAVTNLADAFKGMSPDQINKVLIAFGVMGGVMTGIALAANFAGPGLLIFGGALLMIGGAVFLASLGISQLATSMNALGANPDIGTNLLGIGAGISAVAASSALMANPLSIAGFTALTGMLNILEGTVDFSAMNAGFSSLNSFMSAPSTNLDKLRETLAMLSESDTSIFAQMKEFTSKPMQVEFKDKEVALNINITNQIDGDQLGKKLQIGRRSVIDIVNARRGT